MVACGTEPTPTSAPTVIPTPTLAPADTSTPPASFRLTILHNNDGESQLVNLGSDLEDFGGVARFAPPWCSERGKGPAPKATG